MITVESLSRHRTTSAAAGRRGRRKLRSRSSPVRLELGRDAGAACCEGGLGLWARARARSPSASPPPTRVLPLDYSEHIFPKQSVRGHSWAYFSVRPPSSPLRIVPVEGRTVAASLLPPPPPQPLHLGAAPMAPEYDEEIKQLILQLLDDLLTRIPQEHCTFESCCSADPAAEKAPQDDAADIAHETNCRNVAVQAPTRKKKVNAAKETKSREVHGRSGVKGADGVSWLGDARALRDEHVRLVRRQLRHIARLNRALDRAARPPHDNNSTPTHEGDTRPHA